jgi:hypothetical protein
MRKLFIVAVGVFALATAGLAVGKGLGPGKTAKVVTGTFLATTASHVDSKTCTTADGKTLVTSHGRYTGLSSGDADFTGPVTLDVHSVVNTTDDVGVVHGKLKVDVASGKDTDAQFDAVYYQGKLVGLAHGHAHDPGVEVLANLSAGFSTTGGFTGGKLGGADGGSAVELGPGKCEPTKPTKPEHDGAKPKDPPKDPPKDNKK